MIRGGLVHPKSRELLLCCGGVTVRDGHPMTRNIVPGSSCTIFLPAALGSSAVPGWFWGDTVAAGAPMGSLPAPPGYERDQPQRRLPRAPCPNSCLIPKPAPTRPQGKAGWAAEGSRAFLAFLFLLGTASPSEPVPEAGGGEEWFHRCQPAGHAPTGTTGPAGDATACPCHQPGGQGTPAKVRVFASPPGGHLGAGGDMRAEQGQAGGGCRRGAPLPLVRGPRVQGTAVSGCSGAQGQGAAIGRCPGSAVAIFAQRRGGSCW